MPHQCTNCDRTFDDGSKEMLSGCPECGGTKFQFRPDGFGGGSDSTSGSATDESPATGDSGSPAAAPPEPTDRPGDSVTRTVGNAAATVRDLVSGSADSDATRARPPEETGGASDSATSSSSGSVSTTKSSTTTGEDDDIIIAEEDPTLGEDTAQADARSQFADPDEMPESEGYDPATGDQTGDDPDESIELSEPGANGDSSTEAAPDSADSVSAEPTADEAADEDRTVADEPDTERADRPDLAELREELNDQFESIRVLEPGQYELNLMELYDREEYIIALQEDGRYSIQVPETWREADA